ncbi:MAG TPA: hypothetical protein VML54_08865 [Candidatus Limnocylindrales bacterium]|nr:hypothetical protein [Candidatus Limnocylindrales bacterium]
MKTLYRLGWGFIFAGLVVILFTPIDYMVRKEELQTASLIASGELRTIRVEELEQQRARLRLWPGIVAGSVLIVAGLAVLQVRRRREQEQARSLGGL